MENYFVYEVLGRLILNLPALLPNDVLGIINLVPRRPPEAIAAPGLLKSSLFCAQVSRARWVIDLSFLILVPLLIT